MRRFSACCLGPRAAHCNCATGDKNRQHARKRQRPKISARVPRGPGYNASGFCKSQHPASNPTRSHHGNVPQRGFASPRNRPGGNFWQRPGI
jgi:hypothetical protein